MSRRAATRTPSPPGPSRRAQPNYLRRLFSDPQPVLDELSATYGAVSGFGAGPVRMAVVGAPDALAELFERPMSDFRWGHRFNVLGFVVGATSMIVSDGEDHRRRRGSVQAAFARRRLNSWIPVIVEETDRAVDRLLDDPSTASTPLDLLPVARRLVQHIVVRVLFGSRLAGRADEIGDLFDRPQRYLESPGIRQFPHPFPHTERARVRADRRALDRIVDEAIADTRRHSDRESDDLIETLVRQGELSDEEIRDQVVTLFGAGYDTTAASLAWMMWRSVLEPGVWDGMRDEADEVFGTLFGPSGAPSGEPPVADDRTPARLEYTRRVMRETLRLHPAGVISPREAAVDLDIAGYRISKGTLVLWSPYLAGRDPQAWPDPMRFDPDRHVGSAEGPGRRSVDTAWVPFGRGERNCIGFALAQMELVLIMARLAQRLDLHPVTPHLPRPVGMVVNRPQGGVTMHVTARSLHV
jgi:cytochrome P450